MSHQIVYLSGGFLIISQYPNTAHLPFLPVVAAESIFIRQSHFEHVISLAEACRSETCWIIAEGEADILVPDTGLYRQAKTQVAGSIVLEIRGPMVGIPEPEDICSRRYDRGIAVSLSCHPDARENGDTHLPVAKFVYIP